MKKRLLSLALSFIMVLSLLPGSVLAAEGEENPAVYIGLGDMMLVENGTVPEDAVFPVGVSYTYDEERGVHVLTMEDAALSEYLWIDSEWGLPQAPEVEIVLKGSNVIDAREQDYGTHDVLSVNNADVTICSGEEGGQLSIYGIDCAGIRANEGLLTIDGVSLTTRCEMGEDSEGGQGLAGSSDYRITGGADLDIWGKWMGIIISGAVTFEDCTVNTNRIHVHSHVEEDEEGNAISDQQTMTIGKGAQVNINTDEDALEDSSLMLLDGSTLKIAGGVLNCNFSEGPAGWVQVGFNEDCAVNTLLLESGELNISANPEQVWDAMYLENGRLVQTGGKLTIRDAYFGLGVGGNASASFEGGQALFEDCYCGVFIPEDIDAQSGDVLSMTGTDMTINRGRFGLYLGGGRTSMTDGTLTVNAGPDPDLVIALNVVGKLIQSGGEVSVISEGLGMYVEEGGEFILQGGKMGLRSGDRGTLVSCGLTDLRGGELNLRGNSHTFVGFAGTGDYLHLGENMFLRTSDATLVERYEEEEDGFCAYYVDNNDKPRTVLSFGSTGGVFAGTADVEAAELSVGVPFVVSADLALGERSGTAVFTLPEGLAVKGAASVNGKAVGSVYDAAANTLTVPIQNKGAAVRFYALANQTMEDCEIICDVAAGENSHTLRTSVFSVEGLRVHVPDTVSVPEIVLSGTAAPGGLVMVYEVSDPEVPVLLNGEGFAVNSLGSFSGTASLPESVSEREIYTYQLKIDLLTDSEGDGSYDVIDSEYRQISHTPYAAQLEYLNIQNNYHGARLDEILQNDILVDYHQDAVYINESTDTKAYNYFPEYPDFFFAAAFTENHASGCCEAGEESSHIISVRVEARGKRGERASIPLYYNRDAERYEGSWEFPSWPPEFFTVYWVEEGVVNRESFYTAAIEDMKSYNSSGQSYEQLLEEATQKVTGAMEEYFSQVTEKQVSDTRYEYFDADGERIFSTELETLVYDQLNLSDGFKDVFGNGELFVKTEYDVDEYSVSMTVASRMEGAESAAFRQTMYIDYVEVEEIEAFAITGATPGQRTSVFLLKQIPRVGDAVQAVDSKLLHDSLVEFDKEFADDMARLTDAIMATMYYRCPYTGKQIPRGNTQEAARILQQLLDLQTEYAEEYQKNKDSIREDMKESLMNGVTLGVNKFGNKKAREAWKLYRELQEELEAEQEQLEYLNDLLEDPNGTLQESLDSLMTKKGMLKAGAEIAADQEWIDEDTKELLDTLIDPDGTYQDAHKFMMKYRDKLSELTDAYTLSLQKELQGSGTGGQEECEPPEDIDPPELPGEAGGEETHVPAVRDPSGYVYEAVERNRLSGVTVTLYYGGEGENPPTENGDTLGLAWNAAPYQQGNPLTTDALGQYQWMVPDGWWQVKYEKSGYETVYSEWLPVPPPQTQVNVGMVSLAQPKFTMEDKDSAFLLHFDRYLLTDSVEAGLMLDGEHIYSRLVAVDTAVAPDGETKLASQFLVYYNKWDYPQPAYGQLLVTGATTYAGVALEEPVIKNVTLNPSNPTECTWSDDQCTVNLTRELAEHILPLAVGYADGVMTGCAYVTMDGVTLTGDTVKVIFLNRENYAPLCPAMTCERE